MCPKCNLRYCSLVCYRQEAHKDCTTVFVTETVNALTEETRKEEEAMGFKVDKKDFNYEEHMKASVNDYNEEELDSDDDLWQSLGDLILSDDNAIGQRSLEDILEGISEEELWNRMTPKQKLKFLKSVEKGTPSDETSKETQRRKKWWLQNELFGSFLIQQLDAKAESSERQTSVVPKLLEPDNAMKKLFLKNSFVKNDILIYNIISAVVHYIFLNSHDLNGLDFNLVPDLKANSKIKYKSAKDLFQSICVLYMVLLEKKEIIELFEDLAIVLQDWNKVLLSLSGLHEFIFDSAQTNENEYKPVLKKVEYYFSYSRFYLSVDFEQKGRLLPLRESAQEMIQGLKHEMEYFQQ